MRTRSGLVIVVLSACGVEPTVEGVEQAAGGCQPDICGANSPRFNGQAMFDFNLDGVPNAQNFSVLGISQGHIAYDLNVSQNRITADEYGSVALEGQNLVDATIWLLDNTTFVQYGVTIRNVNNSVKEVVPPNDVIETYVLEWAKVTNDALPGPIHAGMVIEAIPGTGGYSPVCPIAEQTSCSWDPTCTMASSESLVFEGDRFNPASRRVAKKPDDRWFNLTCGVHLFAKMRLTNSIIHKVGWAGTQTAFKMLSADYCGTGFAFTVPGQPLVWQSRGGMNYYAKPSGLEARWNPNGAMCIETPRLVKHSDIAAQCGFVPPACTDTSTNWDPHLPGELITSANY